eukprot:4752980-Pyramimonas_sp.AAC.1
MLRRLKITARRQPEARGSRADVRATHQWVVSFVWCVRGRAHSRADLAVGFVYARETSALGLRLQKKRSKAS